MPGDHESPQTPTDQTQILRSVVGYLNFSSGKPDPRFGRHISDLYELLGGTEPWVELYRVLRETCRSLEADSSAFRDTRQAQAVTSLVFEHTLPAYRKRHEDLLFHLDDAELFGPFFLARLFEAVLSQGGPWDETERVVRDALGQLNDFIGHRPVAVLETQQRIQPYDHERVRPIPLYIRQAGVAAGKYQTLVSRTLNILQCANPEILSQANFDLELLDELALDPRAYDFGHPVHQRPNYVFGEWDPHHLDGEGRYRRFVVRGVTMDALLQRVRNSAQYADQDELLYESAAVLAATCLMASGISGSGPDTHDSSVTLDTLIPRIARYRDAFYDELLKSVGGSHGDRLRQEAAQLHQPFAAARQHLNQYLARTRALQLQHVHLAQLFAAMGYPDASRQQVQIIPTTSARILGEIQCHLTASHRQLDRGERAAAWEALRQSESSLDRGIRCGAIVDPWNILGFQAQFSIFAARENTVPDHRIGQLTALMEQFLSLYARLLSEAAGAGDPELTRNVSQALEKLADWWDQFASTTVAAVRPVHGRQTWEAAEHVAKAMAAWHGAGESAAGVQFWTQYAGGFNLPRSYALVIQALLEKADCVAAMALLMHWLGRADEVPLEDDGHSFHPLALRWLLSVVQEAGGPDSQSSDASRNWLQVKKFFDFLEANAGVYWEVPSLQSDRPAGDSAALESTNDPEGLFAAAYEGVTYRDSARDGYEGETLEAGSLQDDFALEWVAERTGSRLRFLTTLAELWQIAAAGLSRGRVAVECEPSVREWLRQAEVNWKLLTKLIDLIENRPIPKPSGSHESMVEYDRRRGIQERLIFAAITTLVETVGASRMLRACLEESEWPPSAGSPATRERGPGWEADSWEVTAAQLQRALSGGDVTAVRALLPELLQRIGSHALLYVPLTKGGRASQIAATRLIQQVLRGLVWDLPRLGLLRETYFVLNAARAMEQHRPGQDSVSEFDQLFRAGFTGVVENLLDAASGWQPDRSTDERLFEHLEAITEPFLRMWLEHSRTVRLSAVERVPDDRWGHLRDFIQSYGRELFTPRFLTLANIRAVLQQGIDLYLDHLQENQDPLHPVRLVAELDRAISRTEAKRSLGEILQIIGESYEQYKDYNATTIHSDYGDRMFMLLEFLRIQARYERVFWQLQPLLLAHAALARKGRHPVAQLWQKAVAERTAAVADQLARELAETERSYGIHLVSVADRLEERFVKPMAVDRARALIRPATEQSRHGGAEAFGRLQQEIAEFIKQPVGSGQEVPEWLEALEDELQWAQSEREGWVAIMERQFWAGQLNLSYEEFRRQIESWEEPLNPPSPHV